MNTPKKRVRQKKRVRRSYTQLFMDKLEAMCDGQQKLVSNKALRDALDWNDARYKRIRSVLLAQNQIILEKGFGGSVGLSGASASDPLNVFISYCHADEELKNELVKLSNHCVGWG